MTPSWSSLDEVFVTLWSVRINRGVSDASGCGAGGEGWEPSFVLKWEGIQILSNLISQLARTNFCNYRILLSKVLFLHMKFIPAPEGTCQCEPL